MTDAPDSISTYPSVSSQPPDQIYCNDSLEELVKEWQELGGESSLWDYLGIDESIFKTWWKHTKKGGMDA
jgi:hypothetical protein